MDDVSYLKVLNVLIAFASFAFVLSLAWQLRGVKVRVDRVIAGLIVVFGLRAVTRVLPPFGEDHPVVVGVLDTVLLLVMVFLVVDGRRIVQAFEARRQAAEQAQIDYDLALHSLETGITERLADELERIERDARDAAAACGPEAGEAAGALEGIATRIRDLREGPPAHRT